jgi:hypothetical protein
LVAPNLRGFARIRFMLRRGSVRMKLFQVTASVLRRARLLRAAYYGAMALDYVRDFQANRGFKREHPTFALPPFSRPVRFGHSSKE